VLVAKRFFRFFGWLLLFSGIVLCSGVNAAPRVVVRETHYDIHGWNVSQLQGQLIRCGVRLGDGQVYGGWTDWSVTWTFLCRKRFGSCVVSNVKTFVDVTYRLPRWVNGSPPPRLARRWNRYYRALKIHEEGHKAIAVQAAKEIEAALSNRLPPASTCSRARAEADETARKIVRKYLRLEKEYDRRTGHGMTQGAVFP